MKEGLLADSHLLSLPHVVFQAIPEKTSVVRKLKRKKSEAKQKKEIFHQSNAARRQRGKQTEIARMAQATEVNYWDMERKMRAFAQYTRLIVQTRAYPRCTACLWLIFTAHPCRERHSTLCATRTRYGSRKSPRTRPWITAKTSNQ